MSGAEPCTASKTATSSPMLAPGRHAEAADQTGAQVREDVAVEVLQTQHVELVRVHHELHAGGIDDGVVGLDLGVVLGDLAEAVEEEPVGELHDVGLVDRGDLLAAPFARVLEGEAAIRSQACSVMILRLSTTPGTTSCSRPE